MIVEVVKPEHKLYNQFNSLLKQGNVIVLYYANWCPHCINMKPAWNNFKSRCKSDDKYKHLNIAEVESEHIDNTNGVNEPQGFPTIKFYKKNTSSSNVPSETVDFQDERTVENLLDFTMKNSVNDNNEVVEKKVRNNNMNTNNNSNIESNNFKKVKKSKKSKKGNRKSKKAFKKNKKTKKVNTKLPQVKRTKKETNSLRELVFGNKK